MEYSIVPTNLKGSLTVLQQYFVTQKIKTLTQVFFKKHTQPVVLCLWMESEGIDHQGSKAEKTNEHKLTQLGDIQWATFRVWTPRERETVITQRMKSVNFKSLILK